MNARRTLLLAGPLLVAAVALYFFATSGRFVSTDNAFLKATKVLVSAEVAGTVVVVLVHDNAAVRKGQPLFKLDDNIYRTEFTQTQVALERVRTDIAVLQADWRAKLAAMELAKTNLAFAEQEYTRQLDLAKKHYTSDIQLDDRKHALDVAHWQMTILERELAQTSARLGDKPDLPLEQRARWREAAIEVEQAKINLDRTTIYAPFDGVVSNAPELGQYLNVGTPALSLVANSGLWVEANFNETDLTHVKPGQPVSLKIEMYPDITVRGRVASISPASRAEFAILPPQNASGNWVQVVQRIPVRIEIDNDSLQGDKIVLRAGMSVQVTIDTGSANTVFHHFFSNL